jgi:hypothetical protein
MFVKYLLPLASLAAFNFGTSAMAAEPDWAKEVGKTIGKEGMMTEGSVYKISLPRSDLNVIVDGTKISPALSLGSWIAFHEQGGIAMVMGDLVLTQAELNPVMSRLAEGGIQVTATHHHLLRADPMPMYVHVGGTGEPVAMARVIRSALEQSKTPLKAAGTQQTGKIDLDTAALDKIIGKKGEASGDIYKFNIPPHQQITMDGMPIPEAMGTATAIGFQPTGGGKTAINGDFVLTAASVNPVAKALRENGIEVVAIHNHMLNEQPRIFFMHFWANDDAQKLARGLRAALDQSAAGEQTSTVH